MSSFHPQAFAGYPRTYEAAQQVAGKAEQLGTNSGRTRYGKFRRNPDNTIDVSLHSTRIAQFRPDGSVQIWSGGWNTAMTWEALNSLGVPVSNRAYVPYVAGHRMTEGMVIAADGTITDGETLTPERRRQQR